MIFVFVKKPTFTGGFFVFITLFLFCVQNVCAVIYFVYFYRNKNINTLYHEKF